MNKASAFWQTSNDNVDGVVSRACRKRSALDRGCYDSVPQLGLNETCGRICEECNELISWQACSDDGLTRFNGDQRGGGVVVVCDSLLGVFYWPKNGL